MLGAAAFSRLRQRTLLTGCWLYAAAAAAMVLARGVVAAVP
ncbi:MAG: hypothetical protein V1750_03260 [Acidobacteriota bacterium]